MWIQKFKCKHQIRVKNDVIFFLSKSILNNWQNISYYVIQTIKEVCYTHLITTPLSNVISHNMMSRLILTLTKQFFDHQFIHFKI